MASKGSFAVFALVISLVILYSDHLYAKSVHWKNLYWNVNNSTYIELPTDDLILVCDESDGANRYGFAEADISSALTSTNVKFVEDDGNAGGGMRLDVLGTGLDAQLGVWYGYDHYAIDYGGTMIDTIPFLSRTQGTHTYAIVKGSDGKTDYSVDDKMLYQSSSADCVTHLKLFSESPLVSHGLYTIRIKDISFDSIPAQSYTVTGTIALNNYSGSLTQTPVEIDLIPTGSEESKSKVVTLTANPETYTISGVLPGTYNLAFKASHWLRKVVTGVEVKGNVTGISASLLNGDCTGDNVINLLDYNALKNAWGTSSEHAKYDVNADLNGDGVINLLDYSILKNNWGKKGD